VDALLLDAHAADAGVAEALRDPHRRLALALRRRRPLDRGEVLD
jgi:hypothetical protein